MSDTNLAKRNYDQAFHDAANVISSAYRGYRNVHRAFKTTSRWLKGPGKSDYRKAAGGGNNPYESSGKVRTRNPNGLLASTNQVGGYLQEANNLKSSKIVLGKRAIADPLPGFFAQMMGTSLVMIQYGKELAFGVNERNVHFELFRTSLGNVGTVRGNIPTRFILNTPNLVETDLNSFAKYDSGSELTMAKSPCALPFLKVGSGNFSVAAINRPQLEDESWNLNKIKFSIQNHSASAEQTTKQVIMDKLIVSKQNKWSTQSFMHVHNSLQEATTGGILVPFHGDATTRLRYDTVINHGKVTYKLMNKGLQAQNVEFIVYKFKKSHCPYKISDVGANVGNSYVYDKIVDPIAQAFIDTRAQYYASNLVAGKRPERKDVTTNPRYKLLPQLSKMKASDMDWSEEARYKCCIPSGARKLAQFVLPGKVYDPVNTNNTDEQMFVDEFTYAIGIAASGVLTTADIHGIEGTAGTSHLTAQNLIGDCYADGVLQYVCEYEETVSACIPKAKAENRVLSLGEVNQIDGYDMAETPVKRFDVRSAPIIPSSQVQRYNAPPTMTFTEGESGASMPITSVYGTNNGATNASIGLI